MKITSKVSFFNFGIFYHFCPFELTGIDLSGNTASYRVSKTRQKLAIFGAFEELLSRQNVRFLRFSNTVVFFVFFFSWKCTNFTTKEGLTKKFESANSFDLKMYSNFIKADINLPDAQLDFFKDCSRHIFKAKATTSII